MRYAGVNVMDHHILVATEGGVFLANQHGKPDHNRRANLHDIMKAITNQAHEFMDALREVGWSDADIQETIQSWGILDAEYKVWLSEQRVEVDELGIPNTHESVETWLYAAQVSAMLEHRACITNGWIINASEDDLKDYRVVIEGECRACLAELMEVGDASHPRYKQAHVDLYRKAAYLWMAKRRLGEA